MEKQRYSKDAIMARLKHEVSRHLNCPDVTWIEIRRITPAMKGGRNWEVTSITDGYDKMVTDGDVFDRIKGLAIIIAGQIDLVDNE